MQAAQPKILIHDDPESFSARWMAWCRERGFAYEAVDCLGPDIMQRLRDCDMLLWHWKHFERGAQLSARAIIRTAEQMGVHVYPSESTCWHYDDKISQLHLLQALDAPLVPTRVFYDFGAAEAWLRSCAFPLVFKLRSGAGAANVQLVNSREEALGLCRTAFGAGFRATGGYLTDFAAKLRRIRRPADLIGKLTRLPQSVAASRRLKTTTPVERGYVYFQKFLPDNTYDTRITVIGKRAFGFRRRVRSNDFRASGSGVVCYDRSRIDLRCVELAFQIAKQSIAQSLACDFLFDESGTPRISEISYCFRKAIYHCTGYWDASLKWREGRVLPEDAILEDLLANYFERTPRMNGLPSDALAPVELCAPELQA